MIKKEETSKLAKFLEFITSKGFRDSVRNIFITLVVIGAVVLMYFSIIEYGAEKVKENTGVDIMRRLNEGTEQQANLPKQVQTTLEISNAAASAFVEDGKLKTKINFDTNLDSAAFAKLSGNGKIMNQTSGTGRSHEFIFEMSEPDYSSLFVYTVIATTDGQEAKFIGRVSTPEKNIAKISIS